MKSWKTGLRPFENCRRSFHVQVLFNSSVNFMLKLGVIKVAKQSSQSPFWGCSYLVNHCDGFQRLPRFPFWQKNLGWI
jgi:hypothetical protein